MVPGSRPEGHLNLNYIPVSQPMSGTSTGSSSPNDPSGSTAVKSPFGNGLGSAPGSLGSSRLGAGSPSHELGARLYSKRYATVAAE
jgi:protein JSN1